MNSQRHANDFRSIGDCDPAPSSRSATSCRANLSADSGRRTESSRCDSSSRRDCSPGGQARDCHRVHWTGDPLICGKENAALYHNNLAEAYNALHRIPEAVACYRRALELQPDFAEGHSNLGNALHNQGKAGRSGGIVPPPCPGIEAGLGPYAHYNLGNALLDQGKWDEVGGLVPPGSGTGSRTMPRPTTTLGKTLQDQGKLDEAAACFRRVPWNWKPDYAKAYNNLGNTLKDQGKLDEAIACWRRALELKPDLAEAHGNLGNALREQGKLDEAVACYRRAPGIEALRLCQRHHNLGHALQDQGKLDEAVACCRRAVELKPDFRGGALQSGLLAERSRDAGGKSGQLPSGPGTQARFCRGPFATWAVSSRSWDGSTKRWPAKLPGFGTVKPDFAEAPHESGQCLERPGEGGRIGALPPVGPCGPEAGLCRGPLQSGLFVEQSGKAGRSDGLLPPGP